jgi:hypothetical protein
MSQDKTTVIDEVEITHHDVLELDKPGREVAPLDPAQATPTSLLAQALNQGMDPTMLKEFMDLQERHEAGEARKAYAADMAKCQGKLQPIVATAENDHTKSYYAKLGSIAAQIAPIYSKCGFSVSFGQGVAAIAGEIRTTARCLHKLGHFEDFTVDFPPDAAGMEGTTNKTPIHARQSSNTYGKRSIVMGIFNLSILSEDDDANAAGGSSSITEEEAVELAGLVSNGGLVHSAILRELGVEDYRKLPARKLEKARSRIKQLIEVRS